MFENINVVPTFRTEFDINMEHMVCDGFGIHRNRNFDNEQQQNAEVPNVQHIPEPPNSEIQRMYDMLEAAKTPLWSG